MGRLRLKAPLYLLTSAEACYRCGATAPVVALACKEFEDQDDDPDELDGPTSEPVLIQSVTQMPDSLLKLIREVHPHYEKRRSRMADSEYFMNVCPNCRSHFGDFFLFSEPEGAFFPMTDEATAAITIRKLPIDQTVEIEGSYSMGLGAAIFEQGKMLKLH